MKDEPQAQKSASRPSELNGTNNLANYSHMSQFSGNNQAVVADQRLARCPDPLLAVGRQGNVGGARVAAVERPFGFPVADDKDSWSRHCGATLQISRVPRCELRRAQAGAEASYREPSQAFTGLT